MTSVQIQQQISGLQVRTHVICWPTCFVLDTRLPFANKDIYYPVTVTGPSRRKRKGNGRLVREMSLSATVLVFFCSIDTTHVVVGGTVRLPGPGLLSQPES